jgi:hypothetical protein
MNPMILGTLKNALATMIFSESAQEKLEVYVVARNANMGGIAADRSRCHEKHAQIREMYAQKLPFSKSYT